MRKIKNFLSELNNETPLGNLNTIKEVTNYTSWTHKKMFDSKEDYKKIMFLLSDTIVLPDNETEERLINYFGEDVLLRGDFGFEPLQELISGNYFTTEQFCLEWMDNRDEIIKLYKAITNIRKQEYTIVSESPLFYICYGGNVTPEIISPENFKKYYIPHYEDATEVLHKKGKVLASHFDANMGTFRNIIAGTPLDVIEAFTPVPRYGYDSKTSQRSMER